MGDKVNDPVQGGDFMRRIRLFTRVNGNPAIIVAAHPVKNAGKDNLIPYGAGAILNEVDGNLTIWTDDGKELSLHWQGKLRGLDFKPELFQIQLRGSPNVLDAKGREVLLPIMMPVIAASRQAREESEQAMAEATEKVLRAVVQSPGQPERAYANEAKIPPGSVRRHLLKLERDNKSIYFDRTLKKWLPTGKGEAAIKKMDRCKSDAGMSQVIDI
jgi:hypothetical protein